MKTLLSYWAPTELAANGILMLHLVGAAITGMMIGYERSYRGRAAGMRMYALVCAASCLLVAVNAFPSLWFGAMSQTPSVADPTRVIQGIMTGVGFLGAGVIVREGFTIRGLSTAASIWMTAAIGVAIGVGFYIVSVAAALMTLGAMVTLGRLEHTLPHEKRLRLSLTYCASSAP